MPNHYQNVLICRRAHSRDDYEFDVDKFRKKYGKVNLCEMLLPQPKELNDTSRPHILTDAAYDWQEANWGVKWGTYDTQAFELKGDGSPVVIAFCTPWGPPKKMLDVIADWFKREFDFYSVVWIGSDPFNDTTKTLLVSEGQ